jgi:ribonuclease P protein component
VDEKSLRNAEKRDATVSHASSPPLVFPRICRLVRRAEYDAVYREGRRRSSREVMLFIRPNGLDVSRFGWSLKKALGSAVRRNRIRRRLREILRLHLQEITPGWDIVIHPRSSVATANFLELTSELLRLIPHAPALATAPAKPTQ